MIYNIFIFLMGLVFLLVGGHYVLFIGSKGIKLKQDAKVRGDRYTWSMQMQFAKNSFLHNIALHLAGGGFFMMAFELYKLYKMWW